MYKKQRIEALSDGILAIAMTLLVLDLKVPSSFPYGHVWEAIKPEWEKWISFLLTFGLAARFWTLQHDVFGVVDTMGRKALIYTFIFLGLIAVLPYTTSLLGEHFSDPSVLTLYFIHELAIGRRSPSSWNSAASTDMFTKTPTCCHCACACMACAPR